MPPLLPEYLSQPVQVVIGSSISVDTDLLAIAATVVGSASGALIGGLVAYIGTMRANRALVRQAKLEEYLTLVAEIQSVYQPVLYSLRSMPSTLGISPAKEIIEPFSAKELVDITKKINTLSRLHAKPLLEDSHKLLRVSCEVKGLFKSIDDRLGGGGVDIISNMSGHAASLSNSLHQICSDMEKYLIKKAKT